MIIAIEMNIRRLNVSAYTMLTAHIPWEHRIHIIIAASWW